MNIVTLVAFEDELEKIANKTALLGAALGGGGTALHGAMGEWDKRHAEKQMMKKVRPEDMEAAKDYVRENRKHRLARAVVRSAIGAGAGAGAGYGIHKGVGHLSDVASKTLSKNMMPASEHAANVLKKGFGEALKENINKQTAKEVGSGLMEGAKEKSQGFFRNLFKRKQQP